MKSLIAAVAVAAFAVPVMSFAESNTPVTRAQVRAQLVELENAGYNPAGEHLYYPVDLQAAEARVAAQKRAVGGVGEAVSSSSASGASKTETVATISSSR
ncbi:MAG: hypothetical protein QOI13_1383 [Paraburkholderia sp.]|jgi:hypothetical protein|nr:hypothetical protein [Paraburkholderia sp.]